MPRKAAALAIDTPLPGLAERKRLLYEHILWSNGNALERYLPAVQLQIPEALNETQRQHLWDTVHKMVGAVEKRHFKGCVQQRDKHDDRVLAFYELARANWYKSPAWAIKTFQLSFSEIEALLQLRRWGIGLGTPSIMQYKRWECKFLIIHQVCKRENISYPEYCMRRYKKYPTQDAIKLYAVRSLIIESLISRALSVSLDELLESQHEWDFLLLQQP